MLGKKRNEIHLERRAVEIVGENSPTRELHASVLGRGVEDRECCPHHEIRVPRAVQDRKLAAGVQLTSGWRDGGGVNGGV